VREQDEQKNIIATKGFHICHGVFDLSVDKIDLRQWISQEENSRAT
jgi:hypothetical protein